MDQREKSVFMAKLCEQTERFDLMANHMKDVAEFDEKLTDEERNLYFVAYKNKVGAKRSALTVMKAIEKKIESDQRQALAAEYRLTIEEELKAICQEVLDTLDQMLIPKAVEEYESSVLYHKMKGDFLRYLWEATKSDKDGNTYRGEAEKAYNQGSTIAEKHLSLTHPIRLGLALNFSVFYYEVVEDKTKACSVAKSAFDNAILELDNLQEESYKDSTLIMQLLRDNLTLWANENSSD